MKVVECTKCIRHGKGQAIQDIVNNNKKINKINNILNNNEIAYLNRSNVHKLYDK